MYVHGKNSNGLVYHRLINTTVATVFVNHHAAFLYSILDILWQTKCYFVFDPPTQSTIKLLTYVIGTI